MSNKKTTLKGELKMDYSDQVLKSEIINLETQIQRDKKILKAYQQNAFKKESDIYEANIKLEQLKRRMLND